MYFPFHFVSTCVRHFVVSGFFYWQCSNSWASYRQRGHRLFGSCFDVRIVHMRCITNNISNVCTLSQIFAFRLLSAQAHTRSKCFSGRGGKPFCIDFVFLVAL